MEKSVLRLTSCGDSAVRVCSELQHCTHFTAAFPLLSKKRLLFNLLSSVIFICHFCKAKSWLRFFATGSSRFSKKTNWSLPRKGTNPCNWASAVTLWRPHAASVPPWNAGQFSANRLLQPQRWLQWYHKSHSFYKLVWLSQVITINGLSIYQLYLGVGWGGVRWGGRGDGRVISIIREIRQTHTHHKPPLQCSSPTHRNTISIDDQTFFASGNHVTNSWPMAIAACRQTSNRLRPFIFIHVNIAWLLLLIGRWTAAIIRPACLMW